LFTTADETGFKIREVPLAGVYRYSASGQIPDEILLMDAQTLRDLNSIFTATDTAPPPEDKTDILTDDIESLFLDGDLDTQVMNSSPALENLHHKLSPTPADAQLPDSATTWNFIIIRLRDNVSPDDFMHRLNRDLEPYAAAAIDWRTAAGAPALLVLLLYVLFNGGLFLLVIAGIIAIVNVLLISIFQRIREIGTLRAIGASNNYIRGLILSENILVSLLSGVLGVLAGILAIHMINAARIHVSNVLIATLLGGDIVSLPVSGEIAGVSVLVALGLGILSSVYPVQFSLSIQPVEAVSKG
ncbi:MAG TPA: ABC transporter permease, partial [Spirochaetia bacterium]|nr:ABC transporter permease [Spirochaetia bacterium]